VRKIAMGYEAEIFGRDMSARFNIVVRRVGCAMLRWEAADACLCSAAHSAMASGGFSRTCTAPRQR
jgi:hypothetical protein